MKAGLAAATVKHRDIASLGCDTWGVDFALLGPSGELLGNPFHYRDARTRGIYGPAFEKVSRDDVYRATGIQFMEINTLFQLFSMARAKSPLLGIARRMVMMAGLFHYFFTGEAVEEFSLATTSQMYDPRAGAWADAMLGMLGIPTAILPRVVPCGTRVGTLRASVADETRSGAIQVTAPACHDTAAAVAAVPARGRDWAYISSGTWSLMGAEIAHPRISDEALRCNFTNEGGVAGTFRFLKNIMGLWLVQQCRRRWEREGATLDYGQMTRMAADAPALRCLVNPDDPAFLNPPDMPATIADYCRRTGQRPPDGRGAGVRCALESLALRYRATLDDLNAVLGVKHRVLHVVGGGSQNDLLNQFTADACGVPVLAGPVEATAAGNVLTQALATGDIGGLDDLRQVVRNSFDVREFKPGDRSPWDEAYERFRRLP
jgi:rhamnulokinase